MKSCVVIFPIYQKPTAIELAFFENGLRLTNGFKHVVVAPEQLIVDQSFGLLSQLEVKRFAGHYFDGIAGYNHLLLSADFYNAFRLFDFMLIHQADVFLFKDELQTWCNKNYDYIGSPWFRPDKLNRNVIVNLLQKVKRSLKKNKLFSDRHNKVGNGGLSLRKINAALAVLALVEQSLLKKYIGTTGDACNEDIFWSLEAPQIAAFKIPELEEGMRFAVEFHPVAAYKYLGNTLPFGCHAPLKHDPEFWRKFIPAIE